MPDDFPYVPKSSPFTVTAGKFKLEDAPSELDDVDDDEALEAELKGIVRELHDLQRKLYAHDRFSLLLIFQAMDAAGKDGTIRAVLSGVNPAGVQVFSFKSPSSEELDHDFLWRTSRRLPERGRIGVFNRSYYEEVLVVRVRPEFLQGQRLPDYDPKTVWKHRFESINDLEKHLSRNGTVVLKFWLNVSKKEQRKRFLKRLTREDKYWKFSKNDLGERGRWEQYMSAYEDVLNATSTRHAPWYAIPADNKPFMRVAVARIIRDNLAAMPLAWPTKSAEELALFDDHIKVLEQDG